MSAINIYNPNHKVPRITTSNWIQRDTKHEDLFNAMFALRHILSFLQQKLHKSPLSKIPDEYSPCISCSCFYSFCIHWN